MEMKLHRGLVMLTLGSFATGVAAQSSAPYPSHSITIVVPTATGGGVDFVARLVGTRLSDAVGQPVIIDNKPGAGNVLGSDIVAHAPPDGYTLVIANNSSHGVSQAFNSNVPYDTIKDFTSISLVASAPNMLLTSPAVPVKTVKDLVDLAKAQPGKLNFGSSGTGSQTHLAGELFKYLNRINIIHVPYKGTAPAYIGLIQGEVQLLFGTTAGSLPHVNAGRIKGLAITGVKREPQLPDLPTLTELGYKGFETGAWYAVMGPANLPKPVVTRLNQEIVKIAQSPDFKQKLAVESTDAVGSTPEECADVVKNELAKWTRLRRETGIKFD